MNRIKHTLLFTAALLFIISFSINVDASSGVTIQKISESALDELINASNNKIVVTFMAAWCGPCIDELPTLNKVYKTFKAQGLKLIGISIDLEGPRVMQPIIDNNSNLNIFKFFTLLIYWISVKLKILIFYKRF
jgi:thiol-disulfide isomerase/thioredoxin